MHAINFQFIDSIAIEYENMYLDLHSNFDFIGLTYDIKNRRVELNWNKSSEVWAKKEIYHKLKFIFNSVSVFAVHARDNELPFSEDDCLSYIGYLAPDEIGFIEGFLPFEKPTGNNDHLVLGFQSELIIKLYSETIELLAS